MREVLAAALIRRSAARSRSGPAEASISPNLSLQPRPAGWTVVAMPQGGGHRMRVIVDRQG